MAKKGKIVFKGNFFEYIIKAFLLFILSVITFGLLLPYYFYWMFKYFFTRLEIEIED